MTQRMKTGLMAAAAVLGLILYTLIPLSPKAAETEEATLTIVYCRDVDGREGIAGARFAVVQIGIPNADGSFTGKESAGTEGSGPKKSRRITVNEAEAWQSEAWFDELTAGADNLTVYREGRTDEDGRLTLTNLPDGLYVGGEIGQTEAFRRSESFVFALPSYPDGLPLRQLTIYPKAAPMETAAVKPDKTTDEKGTGTITGTPVTVISPSAPKTGDDRKLLLSGAALVLSALTLMGELGVLAVGKKKVVPNSGNDGRKDEET